jgi:DNA polymerase-3 subunit epsilon
MREVVLDTETTGLEPAAGHRVVEIGMLELINHIPSGRSFHRYINPERDMPAEAYAVHGLSSEFLRDKPTFAAVADEFLTFIGEAPLVIHNAAFDLGFLNSEFTRLARPLLDADRVIDTLVLARQKHPMGPNNLDALCKRYGIDNGRREKHGALLDAELLADVFLALIGGRQTAMQLTASSGRRADDSTEPGALPPRPFPLACRLTPEDESAHAELVKSLGSSALWLRRSRAR